MLMKTNRCEWLYIDDYVIVDVTWFKEREYRLKKNKYSSLCNEGFLRIISVTEQGQSILLTRINESIYNSRVKPLHIQLAHHSSKYPVEFSSRCV